MTRGFVPNTDNGLLLWSANFSSKINATPLAFQLTAEQAAEYAAVQDAYAAALLKATAPATRGLATVATKNTTREALRTQSRSLGRMIDAQIGVTNEQRQLLGLTVRKHWTRIPEPADRPTVRIVSVDGRTIQCQVVGSSSTRRTLPGNVASANVYFFVGDQYPADDSRWIMGTSSSRSAVELQMSLDVPPDVKVWIAARWQNPRAQRGPMSIPVATYIQMGSVVKRAA